MQKDKIILLYFPAFIIDMLSFLVFFFLMYRAGERNFSSLQCAVIMGSSPVSYMVGSFLIGFFINRNNAKRVLYASIVLTGLTGALCIFSEEFKWIVIMLLLFGVASALFWNSFQAFMRNQTPKGNLAKAIGLYTLAWSGGIATGFVVSGSLYTLGQVIPEIPCLVVIPVLLLMMQFVKSDASHRESSEDHTEQGARAATPIYLWIGWLLIFAACFFQRSIQTYFPVYCAKTSIPAWLSGTILFVHLALQAFTGFFMQFFKSLLYRKLSFILAGTISAIAMLAAGFFPDNLPVLFTSFSIFGMYTGFAFFCAVYYSSNYGRRSFNVGVNEFLVGLGGIAGVMLASKVVEICQTEVAVYYFTTAGLIVFTFIQWSVVVGSNRKKVPVKK
jgi:MFS family permease